MGVRQHFRLNQVGSNSLGNTTHPNTTRHRLIGMATAHSMAQLRDGTASQVRNHTSSHGRHITSHDAHMVAHMVVFTVPEQAILFSSKTWRMPLCAQFEDA